jgi:hypothetical protein
MIRISPKLGFVLICLVAALGVGAYVALQDEPAPDLEPVIARVDGTPIYLWQARYRVEGLTSIHGTIEDTMGSGWQDIVMRSLVDDVIVRREALARDLGVSGPDLEQALQGVRDDFESEEAYQKWLQEQGMTESELERRIEINMLTTRLYLEITSDVQVSHEEIHDYYLKHETEFTGPDGTPTLLEVRDQIRSDLLKKEQDGTFGAWLEQQRKQVNVEIVIEDWWRRL